MKAIGLGLFVIVAAVALADETGFAPLFNGQDFAGWDAAGNRDVFRIQDGAIVGGSLDKPVKHNEFFCTEKEYADFELKFETKLVGQGDNAGVQFRSQRVPNHHEVSGYQCDIGHAFGRSVWGALYDESRRNKMLAEGDQAKINAVFKKGDWNEMTVRCEGARIQIWLNGERTVDYTEKDDKIARTGVIGLQIHGGKPAEAWYRNIRVKKLPAGQ